MDEELCQKLFAQGVEAGQQRRYAEAAGIFTRLLEVGWPEAGLWLGRSYHGLGDYELAVQIFKNQIRIYPGRGDLWFFLGRSLLSLGFHGKAVTIFLKAREAGFSSVQLWGLLGTAYLKSRRPAQAVECFSQALASAPGNEGMRVGLLNSLLALAIRQFHLQQFDQSRKHLEALIQQGADGITPRLYLANNLRQLGEHKKALEHYKTAQSFRPEDKVLTVYQADCLLALGRKSEALALLQAQGFDLASVPVTPTAKGTSRIPSLDLPFLLFQQGRYRQAVFYALQGIKNHQENTPDLYVLTARSYYRLGEKEKSLAHYRQARKRQPRNEEVFYEELSLLWELGDYSGILTETAGFSKEDRTCAYYRLLA